MRRAASLAIGVALLAAAWLGPLPGLARGSFAAHMTLHMLVVAVAAPLIALGLAGGRLDPVRRAPRLFTPVAWSIAELVIVWTWHAPALHHLARHGAGGLVLEQASFVGCGVALWLAAFGGPRPRDRGRTGAGVIALLLTSMHMTLLGALLALAPRPLFAHVGGGRLSALEDQHLGGAIMLGVGGVAYLLGGLVLSIDLVRAARRRA